MPTARGVTWTDGEKGGRRGNEDGEGAHASVARQLAALLAQHPLAGEAATAAVSRAHGFYPLERGTRL